MAKNWLHRRRWKEPPPPGAVIDEAGNVVAVELQDGNSEADDFAARFAEFEREAKVRKW